jgi:CheY-like chemotaxis protein
MAKSNNTVNKVLVIETTETVRNLFSTILAGEYDQLLFTTDAEAGYRMALAERPDVIITDYLLPRPRGRCVCERVREHPELSNTPVVVTTSWGISVSELAYFKTGCDQLVRKPFRCEDIHYAIKKATRMRQRQGKMIQVLFNSGDIDMVDAQTLDILLGEQKIFCFRRQDGVAVIGRDPVRSNRSGEYVGPDRRNHARQPATPNSEASAWLE